MTNGIKVTSKKLFDSFLCCFGGWYVHEFIDVVDNMGSNQNIATKIPAVHTTNGYGRTVELIIRQFLNKYNKSITIAFQ